MSRIRIVGGSIIKTSKGATTIEVLDGNFASIASKENVWDGGEKGNTHHDYVASEIKRDKAEKMLLSSLEGVAFFIHGTSSNSKRWNENSIRSLMKLTNNKTYNTSFNWDAPLSNNTNNRAIAAKSLAKFVIDYHRDREEITLIGHSHGGNVVIQAIDIIYKTTSQKINIITISTPAYNGDNDIENPKNHKGINDHIALWNNIDGVSGELAGDDYFTNSPKTRNVEINVDAFYKFSTVIKDRWGNKSTHCTYDSLGAHSFDVEHPELIDKVIKQKNIKRLNLTTKKV
jgi:hypothetical protein